MMSRTRIFLWSLGILVLGGCELTVNVDLPEHEPKLVVNARMAQGIPITVEVTESKHILADSAYQFKTIKDATVTMVVDEKDTTELDFEPVLGQYIADSLVAEAGRLYEVYASHPDYKTASASTTIPLPVQILNVKVEKQAEQGINGVYYTRVGFDISDPQGVQNFYGFLVAVKDPFSSFAVCFESNNPVFSGQTDPFGEQQRPEYCEEQTFSDNLIASHPHHIDVYIAESHGTPDTLELILRNYDQALFYYNRSIKAQQNTMGNPFAEPVIVYNNIENGFGILGGYSETTKEVVW